MKTEDIIPIPSVTIIIPTYNGSKFIVETIKSCLNQSHENLKIIVFDNGSTDNTYEIIQNLSKKLVIIHSSENIGLPRAINSVMLNDESDFFIYLGHDDILEEDHVSNMLQDIKPNHVMCHCNCLLINEKGEVIKKSKDDTVQEQKTEEPFFHLSLHNFISVVGLMVRTSTFKSIGGWDERYFLYGEWLFYTKILAEGDLKYNKVCAPLYRQHSDNATKNLFNKTKITHYFFYEVKCRFKAYSLVENKSLKSNILFFEKLLIRTLIYSRNLLFR